MDFIQSYTRNADEIRPRLWLGNFNSSQDKAFLSHYNINVVFNCTKNLVFSPPPPTRRCYRIPIDDNLEAIEIDNLSKWAPEAILLLVKEYYSGANILVHCAAGMQRSAATVAMFLIATEGMTPDQAIADIKSRRRIAFFPSANFRKSIESFYKFYTTEVQQAAAFNKKTQ